jgi:hypothetical protein
MNIKPSSRKRQRKDDEVTKSSPFEMVPEPVMNIIYQYVSNANENNSAAHTFQHFGFLCKSCLKDCVNYLQSYPCVYRFDNKSAFSFFAHEDMMKFILLHKIKISHLIMNDIDSVSWMRRILRKIVQQCNISEMKALTITYTKEDLLENKTKSGLMISEDKNHKKMAVILENKMPSLERLVLDCLGSQGQYLIQCFASSLVYLNLHLLEGMKHSEALSTTLRQCRELKELTLSSICKHYTENYTIHSQSLEELSIHLDRDILPMDISMDLMCPRLVNLHIVSNFCSYQYGRFLLPCLKDLYIEQREFKRANASFQELIRALVSDDSCPNLQTLGLCCKIENWSLRIQSNSLVEIRTDFDDAETPSQVQYECPSLQHLYGFAKLISRDNLAAKLESTCLPAIEEIARDTLDRFQCTGALDVSLTGGLVHGQDQLPANCIVHFKKRQHLSRHSIW